MEKSDNNYDDKEHRKELITEGLKITKKKYSLSQEEIFFSAPELEAVSEYREVVLTEIPGSPISETSGQCKRGDDEGVKYVVPKMDSTYNLIDEEGKEEVINVMPSSGTIRKSNTMKNPPSTKLDDFYGQFRSE
jgi:hypothetical protein